MSQQPSDSNSSNSGPIEDKALSQEDAFQFISEDDPIDKIPPPPEKKADDEKEIEDEDKPKKLDKRDRDDGEEEEEDEETSEEEDELKELEEELEDPDEEKLEVVAPVRRREILKKYPTLFKDFPYLEKAYYREQQFTQVYPTIDEAKDAREKAETLGRFEEDIVGKGNQKNILKLIKENNPKAFNKVVDDYLDNLGEVDERAYTHVISTMSKQTIKALWDHGKEMRNDDGLKMQEAAVILNQFLFGSSKYKPPVRLSESEPEEKKEQEISERERSLIRQAFDGASTEVSTKVNRFLQLNIEANIDPKKTMTEYIRKNATKDAIDKIQDLIDRDSRFKTLADRLWEASAKENFSKSSQEKIIKAYIAKGKSLLAPVVKSARNEALRGMGRKIEKDTKESFDKTDNGDVEPERERSRSSSKSKAKEIPRGMSTFDALNTLMGD